MVFEAKKWRSLEIGFTIFLWLLANNFTQKNNKNLLWFSLNIMERPRLVKTGSKISICGHLCLNHSLRHSFDFFVRDLLHALYFHRIYAKLFGDLAVHQVKAGAGKGIGLCRWRKMNRIKQLVIFVPETGKLHDLPFYGTYIFDGV